MTSQNPNKSPQTQQPESNFDLTGFVALGHQALKSVAEQGEHKSTTIQAKDGFGEFTKRWDYTKGCVLGAELEKGITEIGLKMKTPTGVDRTVGIGKTPAAYDPSKGGAQISSAGDPGEYFLVIIDADKADNPTFRYLDLDELADVAVENGSSDLRLNPSPARQRQMHIAGAVEQVSAFTY